MTPRSVPPTSLEILGWISLAVAFAAATVILVDIFVLGRRQKMAVMNIVYPVTALYWGPVALWAYLKNGCQETRQSQGPGAMAADESVGTTTEGASLGGGPALAGREGGLDCGAGCTLGDIGG